MAAPVATEIASHLRSKHLPPSSNWLTTFLSSTRASTPLPALRQTALFRILASDLSTSVEVPPSSLFPSDIHAAHMRERRLPGPIPVQVMDIEDVGRSRWSQIEALEATERGEGTAGRREVVRIVPGEEDGGDADRAVERSTGPHKLVMQDAKGARVFGVELMAVEGIGLGMNIGTKMVLRDVLVARGVVLLDPRSVTILGGKIEALHKAWKEGRKEALKAAVGARNTD